MLSFFASNAGALSRLGPTLPLEPAGLKVWQELQPFEANTDFPCAGLPAAVAAVVADAVVVVPAAAAAVVVDAAVVCVVEGAATVIVRVTVRFPPAV
jgi:hypothetical protein